MKRMVFAAVLLCALLVGCGRSVPERKALERISPTKETENDDLRCYPLDAADCRFLSYGEDLLVLCPQEGSVRLLRCSGKGLAVTALTELPLGTELCCAGEKILCYDPGEEKALIFSPTLTLVQTCSLPDCAGLPLMDGAGGFLYYATGQALVELELDTGIHRTLRHQESMALTALLEGSGLLLCAGTEESLYIQIEDGALTRRSPLITGVSAKGSRVQLCAQCGFLDCLYLGQTMLPLPAGWDFLTFLPGRNAALVLREENDLAIYDLSTGNLLAEENVSQAPEQAWATEDGRVFFTAGERLYQWEPEWMSQRDSRVKITALYTREAPDEKGLTQCRQRGTQLEERYGVRLRLFGESLVEPKGVTLEQEHITATLLDTLTEMEKALSLFPKELLSTAFSGGGRFYLCPVRSIRVNGQEKQELQFWSGRDCYLVIAASDQVQRSVVRVLSPLLDRQVLMKSDAYDRWDSLNPPDFSYGSAGEETAFVTSAATESPAADRAELLWAAMEPGNRELFLSAQLQNKLRTLSQALRQFLPSTAKCPWEQYLWRQ